MSRVGAVVIGRNERERLKGCLRSLASRVDLVVYVDSGSTDGSVEHARSVGVEVIELDTSRPFSAARARNSGFLGVRDLRADVELVQFVDGDCELIDGWLDRAVAVMGERAEVAVVCGRTKEANRSGSIYKRLCDMEFEHASGYVDSCGGIFLARAEALERIGGFDETIVAGEEPELCLRLRKSGWSILRLDDAMVWQDSGIERFRQWWKRSMRSGHAYAEAMDRHGPEGERFGVRESVSIWMWGLGPLILGAGLAWPTHYWSLLVLVLYPLQALRIAMRRQRLQGNRIGDAALYGTFVMLGKWAQMTGQVRYWSNRIRGRQGGLIEYK